MSALNFLLLQISSATINPYLCDRQQILQILLAFVIGSVAKSSYPSSLDQMGVPRLLCICLKA